MQTVPHIIDVYLVRAYNEHGEWMDDIGVFESKEQAEKCLLQCIEGDKDGDAWEYYIEDYCKEV